RWPINFRQAAAWQSSGQFVQHADSRGYNQGSNGFPETERGNDAPGQCRFDAQPQRGSRTRQGALPRRGRGVSIFAFYSPRSFIRKFVVLVKTFAGVSCQPEVGKKPYVVSFSFVLVLTE